MAPPPPLLKAKDLHGTKAPAKKPPEIETESKKVRFLKFWRSASLEDSNQAKSNEPKKNFSPLSQDKGHGSLDRFQESTSSISSGGSGSTGTLSSGGSVGAISDTQHKHIRFHYHHKDGTKNDDPGESDCSTVYACDTLRKLRQKDFEEYQEEEREKIIREKIHRAEREHQEEDHMNLRVYRRLLQLKERIRRQKEQELAAVLTHADKPIITKPTTPSSDLLPDEIRRHRTVINVVMAQRGVSTGEMSTTTDCTLFIGPMAEGFPPELRVLRKTDRVFLRHRHCAWKSGCMNRGEENIFQLLNGRGHKMLHVYGESPSIEKFLCKGSAEYSCFDESENEIIRILATTNGFPATKIKLKVYAAGSLIGFVEEKRRFWRPRIHIKDASGHTFAFVSRRLISAPWNKSSGHRKLKAVFTVKTYGGIEWGIIRGDWIDLQVKLHSAVTHFGIKFQEELNVNHKALLTAASLLVYLRFFNGKMPRREIQPLSHEQQEMIGRMTAENRSQVSLLKVKSKSILDIVPNQQKKFESLIFQGSFLDFQKPKPKKN